MANFMQRFPVTYRPIDQKRDSHDMVYAEQMFRKFVTHGFSYDELSRHPDTPSLASAELLAHIMKDWIREMLSRQDTGNFLIYKIISAFDPDVAPAEVFGKFQRLVDRETAEIFMQLLDAIWDDPPDEIERLEKIKRYWSIWIDSHSARRADRPTS